MSLCFLNTSLQESGSTFLQGSVFDFGYMGARTSKGEWRKTDAHKQLYMNVQIKLKVLLLIKRW